MMKRLPVGTAFLLLLFLLLPTVMLAQRASLYGTVTSADNQEPVPGAQVFIANTSYATITDQEGAYALDNIKLGAVTAVAFSYGLSTVKKELVLEKGQRYEVNFVLNTLADSLEAVEIINQREATFGLTRLNSVEGTSIYEGKKNEVIVIDDLTANLATNNARQAFSKVAGLNIWESDGAGLQLGIGARGLSPNRTSNFNVRQNGYDISADALGYPESYYTPPLEALERVEVVRGAASLQYGTQFGGMLNFVFKEGPKDKPIGVTTRQTVGSFGLFSSFNAVGGQVKNTNYYAFYQRKQGNGWRPNSGFEVNTAYAGVRQKIGRKLSVKAEYTYMDYLAQQPGGLTDRAFAINPRQSVRERNWFKVTWNVAALTVDYKINSKTSLNSRNFLVVSSREALGNLERINRFDLGEERLLLSDSYVNFGNETRLIHRYKFNGQPAALLIGTRVYRGFTERLQGDGTDGSGPDFFYLNPDDLEYSNYEFPSQNNSVFAENIFNISPKFSITPGIRFEHIGTQSSGFFKSYVFDFAGNVVQVNTENEADERNRSFVLLGIGFSYKPSDKVEWYANASQNFRGITFNDLRLVNPNLVIDPELTDERGYNLDLGVRGQVPGKLLFDVSAFHLRYDDRIGLITLADQPPLFLPYGFRTNIADARIFGLEALVELNLLRYFLPAANPQETALNWFTNFSLTDARYINTAFEGIENNRVELVAPIIMRTGLQFRKNSFSASYQFSYTGRHFTDATNATFVSSAIIGEIPAYWVMDLSARYTHRFLTLETGLNNLTDNAYFTRRAQGYPGPGIIPADGRSFYVTLGASF